MNISDLLEKKRGLVKEAGEIRDRVYAEHGGEWSGDDTAKFDDLTSKAEKVQADIDRLARLDKAERSLEQNEELKGAERRTAPTQPNDRGRGFGRPSTEDRALAFHAWMAASSPETRGLVTDRHREAARRCGVSLEQGDYTIRLAKNPPRSLRADDIRDFEKRLTQVSVVSPDLGGHYTVPDDMLMQLEVSLLAFGGVRSVATVTRTSDGRDIRFPTLNDTSNKGQIIAEGVDLGEQDLTFNALVLNAYKYSSKRVPVSWEYLQDEAINFSGRIGAILGERIGRAQAEHFTTGDGSGKPNGIVTAAGDSSVTTAAASTITYDNLMDLKHSVDPAYRVGARFMFDDTTLKLLKKLKVAQFSGDTGGFPLWRPGLAAGEPDTIDGDPYVVNQEVASGSNAKAIIYGDLSRYQIRDVQDVTLLRLNERYAELGIVAFVAWVRSDGDLLDAGTDPVKYLTMGA